MSKLKAKDPLRATLFLNSTSRPIYSHSSFMWESVIAVDRKEEGEEEFLLSLLKGRREAESSRAPEFE